MVLKPQGCLTDGLDKTSIALCKSNAKAHVERT